MTRFTTVLLLAALALSAPPAAAEVHVSEPQLLPIPGSGPVSSTPAPLAPPINPGYVPSGSSEISPILTEPAGPVAEYPQPLPSTAYPAPQLPGPIDQQKMTAYRNDLQAQQWELQSQGQSLGSSFRGREILQQLNAPSIQ